MFCQMGKGKRAQLHNVLGLWCSARQLWHALPPTSLLSGLESSTPALASPSQPGPQSRLAGRGQAMHPTHRVPTLHLPLLQRLQTSKIASFRSSLFGGLGFGTSHAGAGLGCFCLSHVLVPCDSISLWKLKSRNRIFVPGEKLTFQD